MKKFLTVAAMLVALTGVAQAQGGGGGGMRGGRGMAPEAQDSAQFARMFDGITLNADQTAKAKEIITKAREATMSMDRQAEDFRAKMTEMNAKRNADLKALLTSEEDRTKFDANAAAGRGRRGGGA